jgi:diguanylate cyclase (GGDEF)-like protein
MLSIAQIWFWRNVGLVVVVFGILVGGTWATVKITTDHLLYQDATSNARSWALYVGENVADLEQIASGEQPSAASMAFFESARRAGQVFRYEIFNREGYSQLISEDGRIALVELSEFSADAVRSLQTEQPVVDAREGRSPDVPAFYARAYVPILVNGMPIAVVAAYVNQTEERNDFYRSFVIAATCLCVITALAFTVPTIAWYRRTKQKQQADRRIRFLAHHDALTGLLNRGQLIVKLEAALAAIPLQRTGLAVHFIDLDRFKEVNDTLGHDGGDFLLKAVAERLRLIIRLDDVAARIGGDEFIVVQTGVSDKSQAEEFASRIAAAVIVPMKFKEQDIFTTASIGIALAPTDGAEPERLLKSADLALYKAKADGRKCIRLFSSEMDTELQVRLELERTIRNAILHDSFELHYQPLFEIEGRQLIGFEALIRLQKGDGTLIPPAEFISVAEDMRLIDKIGEWVLQQACRTAATWPEHLSVAVNLSPAQFVVGSISTLVASALKDSGLPAHRLELEVTENLLLGSSEVIARELQALKSMGVAIVMDDFGTGYSSLSYLWRFPFDKIKIDRSFMQGLDRYSRDASTVVRTIIALARELNMRVTVEGVETAEQAAFLNKFQGDQVQGFFFGRPIPASEVGAAIYAESRQRQAPKLQA